MRAASRLLPSKEGPEVGIKESSSEKVSYQGGHWGTFTIERGDGVYISAGRSPGGLAIKYETSLSGGSVVARVSSNCQKVRH